MITVEYTGENVLLKDTDAVVAFGMNLMSDAYAPYMQPGDVLEEVKWTIEPLTGDDPLELGDGVTQVNTPVGDVTPPAPSLNAGGVSVASFYGGEFGTDYTVAMMYRITRAAGGNEIVDQRSFIVRMIDK